MTITEYVDEKPIEKKGGDDVIEYTEKDIQETPDIIDGVIIAIEETNAGALFGDKAKDKDQQILNAFIENKEFNIQINEPVTKFKNGFVPQRSKLANIIKTFSSFKLGTKVKLLRKNDGYYKIKLE